MLVAKKYLPVFTLLFLLICSFSFNAYAGFDLGKGVKASLSAIPIFILGFISDNYPLSLLVVLLVTFGFDYDYYIKNKLRVNFSRFTTIVAIAGVFTFTIIKLFY